jgi:hypothetical protein
MYHPGGNSDIFFREAMKQFSPDIYETLHGKTRKCGGLNAAYEALGKFGARPIRRPKLGKLGNAALKYAVAKVTENFKLDSKPTPITLAKAVNELPTDSSAGISFPGRKKGEAKVDIYTAAKRLRHVVKQQARNLGCGSFDARKLKLPFSMISKRSHLSSRDKPKFRLVWNFPAEIITIEQAFAWPLYQCYKQRGLLGGPLMLPSKGTPLARDMYTFLNSVKGDEAIFGLDISSFDTSVHPFLIKQAFKILSENLGWWEKPTPRQKNVREIMWKLIEYYFINTPVLMPDGRAFRKAMGVPSGSAFTQLIDSIVNSIYVYFTAYLQRADVRELRVLGDDSVFFSKSFDVQKAANHLLLYFGVRVNLQKSESSNNPSEVKVLGYHWCAVGPLRSTRDWFLAAMYPEGFCRTPSETFSRLVGIMLAGGYRDDPFMRFVRFFQTGYLIRPVLPVDKNMAKYLSSVLGLEVATTFSTHAIGDLLNNVVVYPMIFTRPPT